MVGSGSAVTTPSRSQHWSSGDPDVIANASRRVAAIGLGVDEVAHECRRRGIHVFEEPDTTCVGTGNQIPDEVEERVLLASRDTRAGGKKASIRGPNSG